MIRRSRPPQGVHSIADLARREGISEKSARGRLREYFGGTLADLGISEWSYGPEDLRFVLSIIRPSNGRAIGDRKQSPMKSPAPIENAASVKADPYSWPRQPRSELTLPSASGVYALFLRENSSLPNLVPLRSGLVYIGLGRNLAHRCHFSGKTEGHSPRRSLAALLGRELDLEPELGANGNYKLSRSSEERLNAWMHKNLLMAFNTCDDVEAVEDALIKRLAPPLNLTKCAQTPQHKALKDLRKSMLEFARAHH